MKTKLLRKIRKRYSITRVDDIGSNPSDILDAYMQYHTCPIYIVKDDYGYVRYNSFQDNYDDAYKKLCDWIKNDYSEQFRHKDGISSVVWWNNNKK